MRYVVLLSSYSLVYDRRNLQSTVHAFQYSANFYGQFFRNSFRSHVQKILSLEVFVGQQTVGSSEPIGVK